MPDQLVPRLLYKYINNKCCMLCCIILLSIYYVAVQQGEQDLIFVIFTVFLFLFISLFQDLKLFRLLAWRNTLNVSAWQSVLLTWYFKRNYSTKLMCNYINGDEKKNIETNWANVSFNKISNILFYLLWFVPNRTSHGTSNRDCLE